MPGGACVYLRAVHALIGLKRLEILIDRAYPVGPVAAAIQRRISDGNAARFGGRLRRDFPALHELGAEPIACDGMACPRTGRGLNPPISAILWIFVANIEELFDKSRHLLAPL